MVYIYNIYIYNTYIYIMYICMYVYKKFEYSTAKCTKIAKKDCKKRSMKGIKIYPRKTNKM